MKSNKESITLLLDQGMKFITRTLAKLNSAKNPTLRRFSSTFKNTKNKKAILKEKYRGLRLAENPSIHSGKVAANLLEEQKASQSRFSTARDFFGSKLAQIRIPRIKISKPALSKFSLLDKITSDKFRKYTRNAVLTVLTITFVGLFTWEYTSINAVALEVDGKKVAIVASKAEAQNIVVHLKSQKEKLWNRKVAIKQSLDYKDVVAKRLQLANLVILKNRLNKTLTFTSVASGINVNGQMVVVVKDEATAQEVLDKLKNSYTTDGVKVSSIAFQEKVEIVDSPVALKDVLTSEKAIQVLKEGGTKKSVYVVKEGDSLWTIARKNDTHVADLLRLNPSLNEHLKLGQEINLVASEAFINVLMTGEQTVKETIPYQVVVKSDKDMNRGKETVKVKGKNGEKQVTYKIAMKNGSVVNKDVLNQNITKVAVNEMVTRGSKVIVAVRARSIGKGSWPIYGQITSRFGRRWGRMHTGVDIDGNTGDPVKAAMTGKVISAGRDGSYGNLVAIKHDNGVTTRYAHLSRIKVRVGQHVDKGQLIGLVGSTGNSTGSHLHFEVIRGGSFQNPGTYLR